MRHFSRTLKKVGRVVVDQSASRTAAFMVSCPITCRSHREFLATVVLVNNNPKNSHENAKKSSKNFKLSIQNVASTGTNLYQKYGF